VCAFNKLYLLTYLRHVVHPQQARSFRQSWIQIGTIVADVISPLPLDNILASNLAPGRPRKGGSRASRVPRDGTFGGLAFGRPCLMKTACFTAPRRPESHTQRCSFFSDALPTDRPNAGRRPNRCCCFGLLCFFSITEFTRRREGRDSWADIGGRQLVSSVVFDGQGDGPSNWSDSRHKIANKIFYSYLFLLYLLVIFILEFLFTLNRPRICLD